MPVIIAGSRDITDRSLIEQAIKDSGFEITRVLSGGARGVDQIGAARAIDNNIEVEFYHAEWRQYGKRTKLALESQQTQVREFMKKFGDSHTDAPVAQSEEVTVSNTA